MAWVTLCSRKMSNGILVNDYSLELFRIQNRRQRLKSEQSLRLRKLQNEQDEMLKNNAAHIHYDEAVQALKDAQKIDVSTSSTTTNDNTPYENIKEYTYDEASSLGYLTKEHKESYNKIKNYVKDINKCSKVYNPETKQLTITAKNGAIFVINEDGTTTVTLHDANNTSFEMFNVSERFNGTSASYDELMNSPQCILTDAQKAELEKGDDGNNFKHNNFNLDSTGAVITRDTYGAYMVFEPDGTTYHCNEDGMRLNVWHYGILGCCSERQPVTETNSSICSSSYKMSGDLTYDKAKNYLSKEQKTTYERIKKRH